ncbi:MAG: SdrD B-like domain-containing protein, partial [Isosphaeraceae bacterium]
MHKTRRDRSAFSVRADGLQRPDFAHALRIIRVIRVFSTLCLRHAFFEESPMWNRKDRVRRTIRRKPSTRNIIPLTEAIESRLLLSTISGQVYEDFDGSGVFETGETGVGGVTVKLYNSSGGLVATTSTSSASATLGDYTFTALPAGTYNLIETTIPSGDQATASDVGSGAMIAGTSASATEIDSITLGPSNTAINYDFGIAQPTGFLQGTVFVDNSNNQVGSPNNNYPNLFAPSTGGTVVPGATIDLYQGTNTTGTPYETTTSLTDGSYSFTGLFSGTYTLVEVPPSGYTNGSTPLMENQSILNPVTGTTPNSITVKVVDPTQFSVFYDSGDPRSPSTTTGEYARLPGSIQITYMSKSEDSSFGQLPVVVSGPGNYVAQEFSAFCVDLLDGLDVSLNSNNQIAPDNFGANGQPTSAALPGDAGRIGYLYDQYINYLVDQFDNPISNTAYVSMDPFKAQQAYDAQALQLAIWKLEYDSAEINTFETANAPTTPYTPLSTDPTSSSFQTFWSTGNITFAPYSGFIGV